jgi:formate dehydrogenase subunit gamma
MFSGTTPEERIMARFCTRIRLIVTAIALLMLATAPALAQRTGAPVDPNADAVKEQQLLQQFQRIEGLGTIPDTRSYVIEQPLGRVWRVFHEIWLHWIGTGVILGTIALLAVFYLWRGPIEIKGGRSGRTLLRFGALERFTHWMMAVSFIILAITGLNITFGKDLLLPLIGPTAFSRWAIMAKYAHNFSSYPFVLGVLVLFVLWVRENIPTMVDVRWLLAGGGMVGDGEPPAWKFNGGQKVLFWFVVAGTIGVAASGLFLLFPFYLTNILGMQIAQVIHALIAIAFVALIIAHIYIGTLGMEGGFDAMGDGEVDLNWAEQHHSLWVEQELGQGRSAAPPAGAHPSPAE